MERSDYDYWIGSGVMLTIDSSCHSVMLTITVPIIMDGETGDHDGNGWCMMPSGTSIIVLPDDWRCSRMV